VFPSQLGLSWYEPETGEEVTNFVRAVPRGPKLQRCGGPRFGTGLNTEKKDRFGRRTITIKRQRKNQRSSLGGVAETGTTDRGFKNTPVIS